MFSLSSLPTGTEGWGRLGSSSISSSSLASAAASSAFLVSMSRFSAALAATAFSRSGPGAARPMSFEALFCVGLQRLRLVLQVADAGVRGDHLVQVDRRAQAGVTLPDFFQVFAE